MKLKVSGHLAFNSISIHLIKYPDTCGLNWHVELKDKTDDLADLLLLFREMLRSSVDISRPQTNKYFYF